MRRKLLPYYNERKCKIDMIVVHCESYPPEEAIKVFNERKVSAHYMIAEDGEIWQLVGEKHRAWHAGVSFWQGETDINSHSIGIELCSPSLGQKTYAKAQKKALLLLLERLIKKYKIKPQNIVGHSDIAPVRKADPGKSFFWEELSAKGWGFWYDKSVKAKTDKNTKSLLQQIGYDTTDLAAVKLAFCRHYIPQSVEMDGDIANVENNLAKAAKNFVVPKNFDEVLKNIAQQYVNASKTPCKI